MQRYRVNFSLLIALLLGTAVVLGGGFALWKVQQGRTAGRFLARAEEARDEGDIVRQIKMYSQYMQVRPDDQEVMAKLANAYADFAEDPDVEPKEVRRALLLLENTVRGQPDNQILRRRLVDMLMAPRVRMLKPALDHILQLLNQNPNDPELQRMRSECLFAAKNPKAVTHAYEMIGYDASADEFDAEKAKLPNDPDIYGRLATVLRRERNEKDLAIRVMDQLVDVNPEDGQAWLRRSQFNESIGEAEASKEDLRKALEVDPDDAAIVIAMARSEIAAAMRLKKDDFADGEAHAAAQQERFEAARRLLEGNLSKNPEDAGLYQMLATVEIREGDYEGAISFYDRGIDSVEPRESQMLWFAKTRMQIEQGLVDDAKKSIAKMRQAEFMAPPFIDYLDARLAMSNDNWFDAAEEFDRLQAFMVNIPGMAAELNFLLGLCYEKLGQFEKALGAYDVSLQADPMNIASGHGRTRVMNSMGQASRGSDNLTLYALMQDELAKPESEQDWDAFAVVVSQYVERLNLGPAMHAVLQGEVYMRRGLYDQAREKLKESYKLDRDNLAVRRAVVKLFASDPAEGPVKALKLLDTVVKDFGDIPILRLERADLLIAINDEDLVDQLFALAEGIDGWDNRQKTQLWEGLSKKFARLRDRDSQMFALRKVVDLSPDALPTVLRLFMMGREAGDQAAMDEAQQRVLAIVGDKNDPTYRLTEAYQALFAGPGEDGSDREERVATAESLIDQALADRPDWNELHIARANIALLKKDEVGALEALDRASQLGRATTLSLYQHVKLLMSRGRYVDALAQMDKAPRDVRRALLGRDHAEALLRTGRSSDAIAAATDYAEAAANSGDVQLWFGRFLASVATDRSIDDDRRAALRERAGDAFAKAVDIDPTSSEAWLAHVTFLVTAGNLVAAEDVMRRAQLVLPEDQNLLMFARCCEVIGRWVDAEALYTQAVDHATEDGKARAMRLLAGFYLGPGYKKPEDKKQKMATPLVNAILRSVDDGEIGPNSTSARWARTTAARMLAARGDYLLLRDAERLLSSNVVSGELPASDRKLMAEILAARPEPVSRLKAVQLLEGLRQSQKPTLKSELDLARLYFSLGEWRKCKEQMINVIASNPKVPGARLLYLTMLLKRGGPRDIEQAIPQLNQLSKLAPNEVTTREMIARVATKRGKTREAAAALRAMLPKNLKAIKPEQFRLVLRVARLLNEFGDYERAEPLYRIAGELGGARAQLERAVFVGQRLSAAKGFELLESIRRDVPPPLLIQSATTILRSPANEEDVTAEAEIADGWLDRALREDPTSVPLRLQRAELVELSRDYSSAIDLYQALLDIGELRGQGRAVVLNNLAYLMALSRDDDRSVDEARGYINEAVGLLGPQTDVLDTRAVIAIAAEDYEGAIKDLELAVIDKPTATKFFHKAAAHLLAGQNQEAADAWERAVDLGLSRESVSQLEKERYDTLKNQLDGLGQRSAQL